MSLRVWIIFEDTPGFILLEKNLTLLMCSNIYVNVSKEKKRE